jgi:hypothetical protein
VVDWGRLLSGYPANTRIAGSNPVLPAKHKTPSKLGGVFVSLVIAIDFTFSIVCKASRKSRLKMVVSSAPKNDLIKQL